MLCPNSYFIKQVFSNLISNVKAVWSHKRFAQQTNHDLPSTNHGYIIHLKYHHLPINQIKLRIYGHINTIKKKVRPVNLPNIPDQEMV